MQKKKRFSVLKLLIVIICITSIIISLAANILFSRNNVPSIFGRVIYVVDENNPMEGDLTTGAALIAKEAIDISIMTGDIVICYPSDNPESLCLRSINYVVEAEDGTSRYFTRDSFHEDQTDSISKDKIVAVCTGYPESLALGKFINFAVSMNGILILLVATSVILVIFIIAAIVSSHSAKEDEENEVSLYDYDGDDGKKKKHRKNAPLFDSSQDVSDSPELERKKMSIADNFSQKQVNPDSPYQKEREKERTMQFKAQRGNAPANSNGSTMSFKKSDLQSSSSASDTLRQEMLRKTAEAEKTGVYNIRSSTSQDTVNDDTGILSKSEVEQLSRRETSVNEVKNIANIQKSTPAKPSVSSSKSSPDISDILRKTETERRKKNPSDMSVDDLLRMIENEKKKL